MTVKTNVGTSTSIAVGAPLSDTLALYDAQTYTLAANITEIGEFGGESEEKTYNPMVTGVVVKLNGVIDYGSLSLTFPSDTVEAGQLVLQSAFDGDDKGAECSIELTDSEGDKIFMRGVVGSFKTNKGTTGDIVMASCEFRINAKPVTGTAAEIAALV